MSSKTPSVLHVSTWQVACGIATYCENLFRALEKQGVHCDIAPIQPHDWRNFLPEDIGAWENAIIEKAKAVDLVHVQHEHGLFGYALGNRFAVKRFGGLVKKLQAMHKPVVTTFHTDVCTSRRRGLRGKFDEFRRRRTWTKYVARYFGVEAGKARAIVHNMATRRSFAKHGFRSAGIHVVPHACLPPRNITLDPIEAKESLGLPKNAKLLAIFGFLGRYKGHDIAIKVLEKLPSNYYLALVGGMHPESNDDFLDVLTQTIPEELAHRIQITGWVDRATADRYFAATDVCLAPYRGDTLLSGSGAITWALSSGRPVVASKIDAFQDVNRLGECMFMVTPEKIGELAWAVQKLDNDPALRQRLVSNSHAFCEKFSWEGSVSKVLDVYSQVSPKFSKQDLKIYREDADAA